jgi:hypothetical protein
MICGWLFRLSTEAYLVLGVPLVALFQIAVRHRSLRELWVRDPEQPLRIDRLGWAIALILLIMPVYYLFAVAIPARSLPGVLFMLCGMAGAILAGFTLRNQQVEAFRRALPSFGAAILIGIAIQAFDLDTGRFLAPELAKVPYLLQRLLFYFAASFTLEEVAFRGAIDPHVYPPNETGSRAKAWGSAFFVSIVWGLWHVPLAGEFGMGFLVFLVIALFVELFEGVPLSFSWRQGGTLVLPAIAHALIDAYRDALIP